MSRCIVCNKSLFRCNCNDTTTAVKSPRRKKGQPAPIKKRVDARGIEWCSVCRCRVVDDVCSNGTCSTRG